MIGLRSKISLLVSGHVGNDHLMWECEVWEMTEGLPTMSRELYEDVRELHKGEFDPFMLNLASHLGWGVMEYGNGLSNYNIHR